MRDPTNSESSWNSIDANFGGEIRLRSSLAKFAPRNSLDSNSIGAIFPAKFADHFVGFSNVAVQLSTVSEKNDQILLLGLLQLKKEMCNKEKKTLVWSGRNN